ncbi:MAG: hypothetical protein Pg6C_09300 [Treponemataceae bacterium]|nr:MAG: hypothetical protein Pg6C_09300 [Treponemataceae bacterium]
MKLPAGAARQCGSFFSRAFKNEILFAAVILCFPAFLLQKNVLVLMAETIFFCAAALFRRGGVRLLTPALMTLCVTGFALLSPFGKVLAHIGEFPITQGALDAGLRRSFVVCGMVFMSQTAVSPRLNPPGKAGAFLARMFAALDALTSEKIKFAARRFSFTMLIDAVDARLVASYEKISAAKGEEHGSAVARERMDVGVSSPKRADMVSLLMAQSPIGWAFVVLVPAAMYALLFV